jgi:hypothetical protein
VVYAGRSSIWRWGVWPLEPVAGLAVASLLVNFANLLRLSLYHCCRGVARRATYLRHQDETDPDSVLGQVQDRLQALRVVF